jgi:ADP-heptose:LPS heptosyltransferase
MNESHLQWTLQEAEAAAAGTVFQTKRLARYRIRVFDAILYLYFLVASAFRKPAQRKADNEIRTILVTEYANFGDIVLLLPFLQNLRIHFPHAAITLLGNPKTSSLLKGLSLVDEIIPIQVPQAMYITRWQRLNFFSASWSQTRRCLRQLRQRKFDLAVTARVDVMDNWMLWLTGAARRVGYGLRGGRFFLTDVVKPDLDHVHGSDRWLAILYTLGKLPIRQLPHLTTLPDEDKQAAEWLAAMGIHDEDLLIGIHPGARLPIRQWGDDNFRTVAEQVRRKFTVKILWFQDPVSGDQAARAPEGTVPAMFDLRGFMAVLSRCRLFICNDSGPMHIAAALGVPVVSVFGSTKLEWFAPLGDGHRVVIRSGFWCRPCGDRCIFDKPYCLKTITVKEVFDASAEAILSLGGSKRPDEDINDLQPSRESTAGQQRYE